MCDGDLSLIKLQEIRLTAARTEAALDAVRDGLAISGAILQSLSIRRGSDGAEAIVRLLSLSDEAAERLTDRLGTRPSVRRVTVEHHWVRP